MKLYRVHNPDIFRNLFAPVCHLDESLEGVSPLRESEEFFLSNEVAYAKNHQYAKMLQSRGRIICPFYRLVTGEPEGTIIIGKIDSSQLIKKIVECTLAPVRERDKIIRERERKSKIEYERWCNEHLSPYLLEMRKRRAK